MTPDKIDIPNATTIAAVMGGLLWGMANVFTIVFAPKPPHRRDIVRALVGALFALVAAVIGGRFVAPWIVRHNGVTDVESISLIGLMVGLGFWASVPMLIVLVTRLLPAIFGGFATSLSSAAKARALNDQDTQS